MKRRSFAALAGLALALPATRAFAQGSGRPVRVVVPLPAGSSNDHTARVVSAQMARILEQPFVIDNKAAGNGVPATIDVVRSAPDGQTLYVATLSHLAINVSLVRNLPYDPRRDLTAIAGLNRTTHCLVVRTDFPATTFAEFVQEAKRRPGEVSIGYSTTLAQMIISELNRRAGIELLAVPYRGTPPTLTDILGGTLHATLVDPGNALAHTRAGRMRSLGVAAGERNAIVPDWPAISETLPGFDFTVWNAMVGPPNMPREMTNRLSDAVKQALQEQAVIDGLANGGSVPFYLSSDDLKTYIAAEVDKWAQVARDAKIEPQ